MDIDSREVRRLLLLATDHGCVCGENCRAHAAYNRGKECQKIISFLESFEGINRQDDSDSFPHWLLELTSKAEDVYTDNFGDDIGPPTPEENWEDLRSLNLLMHKIWRTARKEGYVDCSAEEKEDELFDRISDLFNEYEPFEILRSVAGYFEGLRQNVRDGYCGGAIDLGDDTLPPEEAISKLQAPYTFLVDTLLSLSESAKETV